MAAARSEINEGLRMRDYDTPRTIDCRLLCERLKFLSRARSTLLLSLRFTLTFSKDLRPICAKSIIDIFESLARDYGPGKIIHGNKSSAAMFY